MDRDGLPRLVPICFVLDERDDVAGRPLVYTPVDEKPKRFADPHDLARVRDIGRRADVTLLVDRWDEDWTRLAWLRCHGTATLLEPGADPATDDERRSAIAALREKYPQYAGHALEERPIIRVIIERIRSWHA